MHKLSALREGEWIEHSHAPTFVRENDRVVAAVPHGDVEIFSRLLTSLEPPYFLLYVLHTPRGEGRAGRYQSPALVASQLHDFIDRFGEFLSRDSRFDLWGHSPSDEATVVWERHDLLYAYGPIEEYVRALHALGFSAGAPSIPVPHAHNYRPELDDRARDLLSVWKWSWSELRAEDEQQQSDP